MPGFIGRRLCPELLFVKPNFQKYTKAAAASRAVFCLFDPDFEAGSLDEAYLDITDYCRAHETTGKLQAVYQCLHRTMLWCPSNHTCLSESMCAIVERGPELPLVTNQKTLRSANESYIASLGESWSLSSMSPTPKSCDFARLTSGKHGAGEAVAEEIRRRVREETLLTCSCGIGPNRLLAKVARTVHRRSLHFLHTSHFEPWRLTSSSSSLT